MTDAARKRLTILGATGSIGTSALDVVRRYPARFVVEGLATNTNIDLLAEQVAEFRPRAVAVYDRAAARDLRDRDPGVRVLEGPEGLSELAARPSDTVLCAMVGAVGLRPILSAIDQGNPVALANKEPLVIAGALIMDRARRRSVRVMPVDSEHSAIFQCLAGHDVEDVHRIHLTASGGPFYGRPRQTLREVSPQEAARHPRWDMGVKISVDSATLMNKGLEVVEARWLFGVPLDRIEVIIHPQSIVHSLVEFTDGNILAHLGPTDMRFPILYALTWPERVEKPMARLDLARMGELTFAAPDFSEFPCLAYAFEAARMGGTAPAVLNAANETAVQAFCAGRLGFLSISDVVGEVLDRASTNGADDLDAVLAADRRAREEADACIARRGA